MQQIERAEIRPQFTVRSHLRLLRSLSNSDTDTDTNINISISISISNGNGTRTAQSAECAVPDVALPVLELEFTAALACWSSPASASASVLRSTSMPKPASQTMSR